MSVQVVISGPVFAHLLHEHSMSPNNQEGFLFGESALNVTNHINDMAAVNEQKELFVKICSFKKIQPFTCYNAHMKLDHLEFEKLPKIGSRKVIGFYSFRRNLPLTMTYREKCIMKALTEMNRGSPVVFGLFSTSFSDNFSIHSMEYVFQNVRKNDDRILYEPASFRIVNLGEDAAQSYKNMPGAGISVTDDSYGQFLSRIGSLRDRDNSASLMRMIHGNLQGELGKIGTRLSDTQQLIDDSKAVASGVHM